MNKTQNLDYYLEMGYSLNDVEKAIVYSESQHVDMLDALQAVQGGKKEGVERGRERGKPKREKGGTFLVDMLSGGFNNYQRLLTVQSSELKGGYLELREASCPVGLMNVSNCCYLNSLLQCYFLLRDLMSQLFTVQTVQPIQSDNQTVRKRVINGLSFLRSLQSLFTELNVTKKRYCDPTQVLGNLVDSMGQKIAYGDQKDLSEVNASIIEVLAETIAYTAHIRDNGQQIQHNPIKRLFYGRKVESVRRDKNQEIDLLGQIKPKSIESGDSGDSGDTQQEIDFLGVLINPMHHNLYAALDNQFTYDVVLPTATITKQVSIITLPVYLFIHINRLSWLGMQAKKNYQQFTFDLEIYMDRYMRGSKVKEEAQILRKKKSRILKKTNELQMLRKSVEMCLKHARVLDEEDDDGGWEDRFPQESELLKFKENLDRQYLRIENRLSELEERNEKYVLVYIFVHRGNAASGHYWGYGKNGDRWYKFDVNCKLIKESDLLTDMEKCGGVVYSLLYAKEGHGADFPYEDYRGTDFFQKELDGEIVRRFEKENEQLKKVYIKRIGRTILERLDGEYSKKQNSLRQFYGKIERHKTLRLPLYNSFSLYLLSLQEEELMKLAIFHSLKTHLEEDYPIFSKYLRDDPKERSAFDAFIEDKFERKHSLRFKCDEQKHMRDFHLGRWELVWGVIFLDALDNYFKEQENKIEKKRLFAGLLQLYRAKQDIRGELGFQANEVLCYLAHLNNELWGLFMLQAALDGFKPSNIKGFVMDTNVAEQIIEFAEEQVTEEGDYSQKLMRYWIQFSEKPVFKSEKKLSSSLDLHSGSLLQSRHKSKIESRLEGRLESRLEECYRQDGQNLNYVQKLLDAVARMKAVVPIYKLNTRKGEIRRRNIENTTEEFPESLI